MLVTIEIEEPNHFMLNTPFLTALIGSVRKCSIAVVITDIALDDIGGGGGVC